MEIKCQNSGELLSLDQKLKEGGEGEIYSVSLRDDLAVKIYKTEKFKGEALSRQVRKLEAMLARVPHDRTRRQGHVSIAWPLDLVQSIPDEKVIGFLMPRIGKAYPISSLHYTNQRLKTFPHLTYRSLCRTAQHLASAARALHESGYVIGDVSESNTMVTEEALVTLVDTDSFQVPDPADNQIYRCTVASELFTAPEVLGKKLEEIDRSPEQDMFGLAVLFFLLLMEGNWPFSGKLRGVNKALTVKQRLRLGCFSFGPGIVPVDGTPPFEILHPRLQSLFRECFVAGHAHPELRPDARTWQRTLKECENFLTRCPVNSQHYYFNHRDSCSWCERTRFLSAELGHQYDLYPPLGGNGAGPQYQTASSRDSSRSASSSSRPASTPRPAPPRQASAPPQSAPAARPQPPPPPPPPSFSASSPSVSLGQPVTLQWTVPNAQTVRITDESGKLVFAGNSATGAMTIYPARKRTYKVTASGSGVTLPHPVTVSIENVPLPMALRPVSVQLKEPMGLKEVSVDLLPFIPLRDFSLPLLSPQRLRHHLPLNSYDPLVPISVQLKDYQPLGDPF